MERVNLKKKMDLAELDHTTTGDLITHVTSAMIHATHALVKCKKMIYISWTDEPQLSIGEIRIDVKPNCVFATKIKLNDLLVALKQQHCKKSNLQLKINDTNQLVMGDVTLTPIEDNVPIFMLSTTQFIQNTDYSCFTIESHVFDEFLNRSATIAGASHDGKLQLEILTHDLVTRLTCVTRGDSGSYCKQRIYYTADTKTCKAVSTSENKIECDLPLSIVNCSRSLLQMHRNESITCIVTSRGLLIQTEMQNKLRSVMVVSHIKDFEQLRILCTG